MSRPASTTCGRSRRRWTIPPSSGPPWTPRALDGAAILESTQAADVKAELIANTEASVGRGAFGVPTFFVGRDMFFGKDRLRDVEEALASA